MRTVLCDTSVVLKWFSSHREKDVQQADLVLSAHQREELNLIVLDLTYYELGHVLASKLGWDPLRATRALNRLEDLLDVGVPLTREGRALATEKVKRHGLSFYDAAYLAVAQLLNVELLTEDKKLLKGGGVSLSEVARSLQRSV